ncbi:scarecrow-like protein 15 [Dorcoceras hygrometricum]|uniref:Scarecrow-like protein 15 n=1 Tax=Dorcoceras hygrometricum TaxID=472368 RepID=A0A2Z7A635_9LAMI|nr:scarecrow-like protein 15 [Dorcoceras hygrometricum]
MKVPFTVNDQNNSKSIERNVNRNPATACSPYEPKSVLELRGSPSPVTDQKPTSNSNTDNIVGSVSGHEALQLEDQDHVLINQNLEDWDSLMRELGLHDDSTAPGSKAIIISQSENARVNQDQYSSLSEFSTVSTFDSTQFVPADFGLLSDVSTYTAASLDQSTGDLNSCNWNVGFDYVDELIRLAECLETNSLQLGQVILARLNQRMRSPIGKPLQRAAFYFKEALQSLLTGSNPITRSASSSEIVQTIKAQKVFASISPITMFSSFTANQAVLDALEGSVRVHVIDFDIGLGGHWASFMKELAEKAESRKGGLPILRISALIPDEYAMESRLIRENLAQFALELNIRFEIEFVLIRTFEYLSFKSIKFMDGEKVAVIVSPAIFRHAGHGFLNDLRRVSPQVVVHVDIEGPMGFGSSSYRQAVVDGLEFYSTLMESLEAANFDSGGEFMQRIETFVLFPKILEGVQASGRRVTPLREALVAAGLRQVGLSQFAEFQAECLLRKVEVRGFHVAKRQAEMLLCWHDRPLVATSAWRY